jgi:hypothetical protein
MCLRSRLTQLLTTWVLLFAGVVLAGPALAVLSHAGPKIPIRAAGYNAFTRVRPVQPALRTRVSATPADIQVTYSGFTQEAQTAFQFAVDRWEPQISSPVVIRVQASWSALGPGILGQAGPMLLPTFTGAPQPNTWYPAALANAIAGQDLDPNEVDIQAEFSSAFPNWYFGTDGNTPAGQYDFVSVVMHELGHGLGFIGSFDMAGGVGAWGEQNNPFTFDRFAVNESNQTLLTDFANNSVALGAQLTGGRLFFNGTHARAAAGGTNPKLYAPATWEPGSSFSHLDETLYSLGNPNSLMSPQIGMAESIHDPGPITLGIFKDLGWPSGDPQIIEVSVPALIVPETGTASFSVRLSTQPTADVTVTVARTAGDSDLTVQTGGSLIFTTANWNSPQSVTMAAGDDPDLVDDSATITCSAQGWTSATVLVTEDDNDTVMLITANPTSVTVTESGTATVSISLSAQPSSDVTVTVARTGGDTDLSVQGTATFTFTAATWQTPQTVTLAAADDADAVDGQATFSCTAAGWTTATVTATEDDNDTTVSLVVTPAAVSVPENNTATFTVRLSAQPTADVTVAVARTAGDTDITVQTGSSLTFTTATWNQPQTVTLAAAEDADNLDGTSSIALSSSGLTTFELIATENDDDDPAIQVSATTLSVPEGSTASFTIRLNAAPTANVLVTVTVAGDPSLAIDQGALLTFTATDWNTPQAVRLAAAADADSTNGTAIVTCAATGWATAIVTATEVDDDTQTIVTSVDTMTVPESGTATIGVHLGVQPAATVVLTVSRTQGDADLTVASSATLSFTPSTWNIDQIVTLAAADDADFTNSSATFDFTAPGWITKQVTAIETDNDSPQILTDTTTLAVAEGNVAAFYVKLNFAPTANVQMSVSRISGDASLTVQAGSALTFTTSNWNTFQRVTLAAAEDSDGANGTAVIRCQAAGWASTDVTVSEVDNDPQRILATPTSLPTDEGNTSTFQVKLSVQPMNTLSVTVAPVPGGDADLTVRFGATVTFTTSNWNTYQTVTVAAAEDTDAQAGTTVLRCSAAGWASADVQITEVDNDSQALQSDLTTLTVAEGQTATFRVRLGVQPTSNTLVTVSRIAGDTSLTVSAGTTLTFTPSNWATYQTVTLAAGEDSDAENGTATIRCAATGWTGVQVTATEQDNDSQTLRTTLTAVSVTEGGTATFGVKLSVKPSTSVAVTVAKSAGDSDLVVTGGTALTFTSLNWDQYQLVTVSAAQDADMADGSATLTVSAPGWASQTVAVTESDDDTNFILTSAPQVSVPEGGTASVGVKLGRQPQSTVAVAVSLQVGGDVNLLLSGPITLNFTQSNWATYQPVTVAATEDIDGLTGTAILKFSASGWTTVEVTLVEHDNDSAIPDLLLRANGEEGFSGDGVYGVLESQTRALTVEPDYPAIFDVLVEDDGVTVDDHIRLQGTTSALGWTVRVFDVAGNQEITTAILGSGWTRPATAPGAARALRIEIVGSNALPIGAHFAWELWASSSNTSSSTDGVKMQVTIRGRTQRVNVSSTGAQALGGSSQLYGKLAVSADGRLIAFASGAANLVSGDTNGTWDVFVRDTVAGSTERISVGFDGTEANGNSGTYGVAISADGRYVAYRSGASNLVPGDTNYKWDVFVYDRTAGLTTRVSVPRENPPHTQANRDCGYAGLAISADGAWVAFESAATNLVPEDTNNISDIFLTNWQAASPIITRVTQSPAGVQANGASSQPVLSEDGRYIVFTSTATNLVVGDTNGVADVFRVDRLTGAVVLASASTTAGIPGNKLSGSPSVNASGTLVAFESQATNLVANDLNAASDVFVRNLITGVTQRVSQLPSKSGNSSSIMPVISANGAFVAFRSYATNLVANDTNGKWDIFLSALNTGIIERVSVSSAGIQATTGHAGLTGLALSSTGAAVVYDAAANDLVADDTNGLTDVFLRIPTLSNSVPLTGVEVTATPKSPQRLGSQITLSATPLGGMGVQYRFRMRAKAPGSSIWGAWETVQEFSASATYAWTPSQAGTYSIVVYAKTDGMTTPLYKAIAFTINP